MSLGWTMYSVIVTSLLIYYNLYLASELYKIRLRYVEDLTMKTAFSIYIPLRVFTSSILYLMSASIFKRNSVKHFAKNVMTLCNEWQPKRCSREITVFTLVGVGLHIITLAPWIYCLSHNPVISLSYFTIAFDNLFIVRTFMRFIGGLYICSGLTRDCLHPCFRIFFENNQENYADRSNRQSEISYTTKAEILRCMNKYKKIDKFFKVYMNFFGPIITLTLGLQICTTIVTTFFITKISWHEDMYVFISMDVVSIFSIVLLLNSAMASFKQVSISKIKLQCILLLLLY